MELADFEKMEQISARVDDIVEDPSTAEALKPWYRQFCKRPCFHDEYLQAFNRPTVSLVDTDGRGVDASPSAGVVVADREYQVDCLIYATGFEVGTDYTRRAGYDVIGSRGHSLSEHWRDGIRSVHGMHVHGFPNMFVLGHTQGGFTVNYPHLLEEASDHVAHIVRSRRRSRPRHRGGNRGRRGPVARATDRIGARHPRLPGTMHARLLQQRGPAHRRRIHRQLLWQRPDGLLHAPGRVEGRGHLAGARSAPVARTQADRPS